MELEQVGKLMGSSLKSVQDTYVSLQYRDLLAGPQNISNRTKRARSTHMLKQQSAAEHSMEELY